VLFVYEYKMSVAITHSMKNAIEKLAKEHNMTQSEIVRRAITNYLIEQAYKKGNTDSES